MGATEGLAVVLVLLARVVKLRAAQRDGCATRGRKFEVVVAKERTVVDSMRMGSGNRDRCVLYRGHGWWPCSAPGAGCGALLLWAALGG